MSKAVATTAEEQHALYEAQRQVDEAQRLIAQLEGEIFELVKQSREVAARLWPRLNRAAVAATDVKIVLDGANTNLRFGLGAAKEEL